MSWVNQSLSYGVFHFNLTITGPSPFNTSSLTHGTFDASHTTNATLIYTPQSIPTPWLVLTFGYALSFVGYIGDIKNFIKRGDEYGIPKGTSLKTYAKIIHGCYSAYRVFASVRKAIQSMHNPLIPTQDLYQAEFLANALTQFTMLDVFYNRPRLNLWIKFIASGISLLVAIPAWQSALRVVHRDDQYYSRWSLVGGNCPLPVASCQQLEYVGCGLNATTGIAPKDPNIIKTANYLRIWEYIGGIGVFIVWPIVAVIMVLSFVHGIKLGLDQLKEASDQTPLPTAQPSPWETTKLGNRVSTRAATEAANREESQEWGELYKNMAPHLIWGLIAQAVPALVLTALQQQKPKSIYVVDSFGPLVKAPALLAGQKYSGGNGTSWSDCFEIRAPVDKWGFLDYWANSTDIVQKIALL
ncbi:hypothetical protein K432DRAFT_408678 [Lepidopterella palustris CBS 459.81]|uniref:Uncharacterized protein n=1 Tax=Lepidopterella palustris CBS 459.81 TaxID=1314670 RepID=A0A8E2E224_9PEZI|nr:hypothetical protein K432DRAFT_408678 [Lepidopterella palustris CBS 459.81]